MVRVITEERRGDVPLFVHAEWTARWPWLVQGMSGRVAGNFSSFGEQTAQTVYLQWQSLRKETDMQSSVLGRQVHGARILRHDSMAPGHLLAEDSDGHITQRPFVLVAVTVADCVPVFIVDDAKRS